ncbi:MAG: putative ABC transporter permease protein [Anaerolineales bacterium]|nr:putative ABC transporter permease protein [Anaerolineales bacterium]
MIPSEFLRVAWESIRKNKLRSLLTMLGIIIGVASVIVMIAISAGTEAAIEEQITGLGSNLVYVNSAFSRGGFGPGSNQAPAWPASPSNRTRPTRCAPAT